MPHIYRCELTLLENTFFSSREISNFYQTEPFIGNYALTYALQFCQSPYFNDGSIHYKVDLGKLNERGIYVTPAAIVGEPRFVVGWFNAQPDTYWYAMGNNALVTKPDGAWAEKRSAAWFIVEREGERGRKVRVENRPQVGRIRMLGIGTQATFYVISTNEVALPSYIRLGKFMSKARITTEHHFIRDAEASSGFCGLLTIADLPPDVRLIACDLLNVPPAQLARNARIACRGYKLTGGVLLPADMHFGVDKLP
ncbi:type I-D CRISPR-associated protein Cas5/Csc1 [Candidatus Chloroploca sp. Khr17]|uniref:type I-D CRISPR-associated protein Cas5/Csc1 n=1 Tax=Candidatus Chloroploca sp. Khr17 TaxID=2496869 RepID=UPI00101D4276|nr:type I-D CRISPR-associated protein Cas5/Csc1 [Candidatus Chloroploca sp. Khr17]